MPLIIIYASNADYKSKSIFMVLVKVYRNIIPYSIRLKIYNYFLSGILHFVRNFDVIAKSKFIYIFHVLLPKHERNEVYSFMGRNGLTAYPYKYSFEYKGKDITVERDIELNLPYVEHNGKKLYFPNEFTEKRIIRDYRSLLIERDYRSAHRYVNSYNELKDKTLLDIGSAEGIFALDTVDLVDHVYLFEPEDYWIKPLEATFSPWTQKVSLIKKYVSNKTDLLNLKIDDFLLDKKQDNLFIKMDIEGAEMQALKGAEQVLKNGKNIYLSVTTYHKPNDPEIICDYISKLGYLYEFSNGYMYWNKRISKGIIRCRKNLINE